MKVYIAGKMTWLPRFNFPAFDDHKALLETFGYDVISPAELDAPEDRARALASPDGAPVHYESGMTHGDFLARDVKIIADGGVEAIALLPGDQWKTSTGALWESFCGHLLGLPILQWDDVAMDLRPVPELELFRAWTGDETLRIRQEVFR